MFKRPLKYVSGGLFSSETEWIHGRRVIDSYEIIVVLHGEIHIAEGVEKYCVREKEVLLLRPGVEHYGTEVTRGRLSFYWFHFLSGETEVFEKAKRLVRLRETDNILILGRQLLHYANTPEYPKECADYLISLIAVEMLTGAVRGKNSAKVSEIREWIRINCDKPVTLSDISATFGYNGDYLTRLFKKTFGMGIKQYVMSVKMSKAKALILEGSLSLGEIAAAVGMEDYNLFLKKFKYHEGVSPDKFRRTYYNTHLNKK